MSADTWLTNCEACSKSIDKLDQNNGIYIVGGSDSVCSIQCVEQVLGKEQFKQANEDWEFDGHSDSYYWTYYEEKEED